MKISKEVKATIIGALITGVFVIIAALPALSAYSKYANIITKCKTSAIDARQTTFLLKNTGNEAANTLRITATLSGPATIISHHVSSPEAYSNGSSDRTSFVISFSRFDADAHAEITTSLDHVPVSGNYTIETVSNQTPDTEFTCPVVPASVRSAQSLPDFLSLVNVPPLFAALAAASVSTITSVMRSSEKRKTERLAKGVLDNVSPYLGLLQENKIRDYLAGQDESDIREVIVYLISKGYDVN